MCDVEKFGSGDNQRCAGGTYEGSREPLLKFMGLPELLVQANRFDKI
jgi:hypothetical protein